MRLVGTESRRTWQDKKDNGFFDKYMSGNGLEIGHQGYTEENIVPILDTAIGVDLNYPGYDGLTLPFAAESQDYVYSSHCLEHIQNPGWAIMDWFHVLKVGGHLVIVVPHQLLYEKKRHLPSRWNEDHKEMYTPMTLLSLIEGYLEPNTYRVRFLEDGDKDFDYSKGPDVHSSGQYEITLVLQKITPPTWRID